MLKAKTPKSKKRAARRATPARKAGSPRLPGRGAVEDVMIAAEHGDLPAALFFVAVASDEVFEEIKRAAWQSVIGRKPGAVTLTNAIVLSRRLQNRRPV